MESLSQEAVVDREEEENCIDWLVSKGKKVEGKSVAVYENDEVEYFDVEKPVVLERCPFDHSH